MTVPSTVRVTDSPRNLYHQICSGTGHQSRCAIGRVHELGEIQPGEILRRSKGLATRDTELVQPSNARVLHASIRTSRACDLRCGGRRTNEFNVKSLYCKLAFKPGDPVHLGTVNLACWAPPQKLSEVIATEPGRPRWR